MAYVMNYLSVKPFGILTFVFVLVSFSFAQATRHDVKTAVAAFQKQKAFSLAKKGQASVQEFTILKPSEIAALASTDPSLLSSAGDPCMMAQPILFGQEIAGTLTNTDCQLDDMSYADFYTFEGLVGEQIQIDMGSGAFDSYLGVANQSGTWVIEDDDGGGATNARIIATLPESGTFIILANSAFPNQFGTYYLRLLGGPNCTFAFTPSSANVPASGGTFSFSVTAAPRCYWAAGGGEFYLTTNSTGLGNGTVTYNVAANTINQSRTASVIIQDNRRNYYYFYVTQAGISCTYSLNPTSVNVGPAQTTGSFSVTTQQGCFWSSTAVSTFISATGSANGNGIVNYTIANNNGANRSAQIRIEDQTVPVSFFTVNQTGRNCTYSVTPRQLNVPASGYSGTYTIDTQTGCTWFLTNNVNWIGMQTGSGSGPATIPFTISSQTEPVPRSGAIQFFYGLNEQSEMIATYIDQAAFSNRAKPFDFDGDRKTDIGIFRGTDGSWWTQRSLDGQVRVLQFGVATDKLTPGDFTGDLKADIAFWRPSTGAWFILRSEDNSFFSFPFGATGDVPVPADYDADGKTDVAVFRPSSGTWFILKSGGGGTLIVNFGLSTDKPVAADYDGDSKADIAIFRPSDGSWWYARSSDSQIRIFQFGVSTDRPVQGDFTGDGKADIAIFRPPTGEWFVLRSEDNSYFSFPFGSNGDTPVAGDYDGDGKFDAAVFRPSQATWFIARSTAGTYIQQFGISSDIPIPSAYVP